MKERVAIITGSGRGIGRAIAKAYASEGARVVITSRTTSELEGVAGEIKASGGSVIAVPSDITKSRDIAKVVDSALKAFGRIDVLVNNAGVPGPQKPLLEIEESEWDSTMQVNVKGAFLFSKAVVPYMLRQKAGNIINISSGAGEKRPRGNVRSLPYNVSKFAIEGFSHVLSVQLKGTGINVNALKPGFIRTRFQDSWSPEDFKKHLAEVGEIHEPEYVKDLAVYLASLGPGELTGESLSAKEWNKLHSKV
ncbi:MAG: SDR family oxidoreductase [Thaumarchaeota archaeon]|nr:SDR family oxidoreductase [Nitrososphaerota archaeon]